MFVSTLLTLVPLQLNKLLHAIHNQIWQNILHGDRLLTSNYILSLLKKFYNTGKSLLQTALIEDTIQDVLKYGIRRKDCRNRIA